MKVEDLEKLKEFSQSFNICGVLGEGSFGRVFKANHLDVQVALKFSKKESLEQEYEIYELIKIGDITGLVDKPVPIIYGFGSIGHTTWLAMELLGPSIDSLLEKLGTFTIKTILMMGIEMLKCLEYLHGCKIAHGDIKADNFAISANDPRKIMIFDFGLARTIPNEITEFRGSLLYASIATHQFRPISMKDDIESLGYMLVDCYKSLPWKYSEWPKSFSDQINYGLQMKKEKNIFDMTSGFFELTLFLMHVDANTKPSCEYLSGMFGYIKKNYINNCILILLCSFQHNP